MKSEISFLTLAAYTPEPYLRFKTVGFPADPERKGRLTITERCWDTTGVSVAFHNHQSTRRLGGNVRNSCENREDCQFQKLLDRQLRWFNCSNWGGNSGGPVIVEGTQDVVGIPAAYNPNAKEVFAMSTSTFYEATARFVTRNSERLKRNKVIINHKFPEELYISHYLQTISLVEQK